MSNMTDYNLEDFITGAGGKGEKPRTPVEAPNTLQSRSTIRVQEVLSEGEVVGLVGDLKGVFLNETAIENADGSYNFPAVAFDFRNGTPDQEYMPGFPSTESAIVVNTEITAPLIRTVSSPTIDAARITVRLPGGLFQVNTENGDTNGYRVGFAIDVRPTGAGTWTLAASKTITGKTTTPYEESIRVEKPKGITGLWDIRVRRITRAANVQTKSDRIDWFVLTELQDIKLAYPDAAVIGVSIDSEATGGAVPGRSYLMDGVIVSVPTTYHPTVYAADGSIASYAYYDATPWNGTFKSSWCDDPAWVLYDLLTNERYGLGEHIDVSTIDIYSFYEASKYNCELIDDGTDTGTLEPRFRFNSVLQAREDAYKVLQTVAASFRCVIFSAPGQIRLIQDRPTPVSFAVNESNVIGGSFAYTGTELGSRVTSVDVSFSDIVQNYKPRTVNEEADAAALARYGFVKLEVTPIGVVHEGQARRVAKWILDASLASNDTVQFSVSWQNALMEIGDVITVSDNFYAAEVFSGVLSSIPGGTANQIKFDREITASAGTVVKFLTFDGVEVTRNIATGGTGTQFTLTTLAGAPNPNDYPGAAYSVLESVVPRQFKVSAVRESSVGVYDVVAVQHDPTKYARIEEGIYVAPPVFTNIGGWSIGKPQNVKVTPETYTNKQGAIRYRLRFNWDDVTDNMLKGYRIQYRRNNGQFVWIDNILNSEYTLDDALLGTYDYDVYAYNMRGVQSPAAFGFYTLETDGLAPSPLNAPTALALTLGGTAFTGTSFAFKWAAPAEIIEATLKDYEVRFLTADGIEKHTLYTTSLTHTVTRQDVINWYGLATRSIKVEIRARDTLERYSLPVTATFTNTAPAVPSPVSLTPFFNYYQVSHGVLPADVVGLRIHHSLTPTFVPGKTNLVKDDVGTDHLVEAKTNTSYYVMIAAYDEWGTDELTYSGEYSVTTMSTDIGITPDAPTDLTVTSALVESPAGDQSATITITWTKGANATQYDLEIIEGTKAAYYPTVSQPDTGTTVSYQLTGYPATVYRVKVRSRAANNVSVWSSQYSHTALKDTTAPPAATGFSATAGYLSAALKWTRITGATDVEFVDVARTTTAGASDLIYGANVIAQVPDPLYTYFDTGLTAGFTYYYKLRTRDTSGNVSPWSAEASVTAAGLPVNSVNVDQIVNGAITDLELASNAVTEAKIATDAITTIKIADEAITNEKIVALAITADKIAANTITASQINATSIRAAVLVANSITAAMITAGEVTTAKLAALAVTADKIAANTITAGQIAANTITATQIAADTITANEIAANTITAEQIAANTITASEIAAGAITASEIDADSVRTSILSAASITSVHIATGAVTADSVDANQIITNTANIKTGIIDTVHIANAAIENAKIANGAITNAKISGTIQSDNFSAGSAGWAIHKATGAAEFSSITARGTITTGTGTATRVEVLANDATYLVWAGTGSKTDANAVFYIKKNGDAYFGGSLSAGVLRNASSTSTIGAATAETGPFGTNGGSKVVTFSLSYNNSFYTNSDLGADGTLTATIVLERSYNGGAWTQLSTRSLTGTKDNVESEPGMGTFYRYNIGGSGTFTDNYAGTGDFNYRARITSSSGWPVARPEGGSNPFGSQNLTVASTEE